MAAKESKSRRPWRWTRFSIMAFLVAASVALVVVFRFRLHEDILFSHFFYLPVVLASLWWDWKGLSVAVLLFGLLLLSHAASDLHASMWEQVVRGLSLFLVSSVVA